ncbi:MAG TPA: helix-hairpin-helix domain-containing protein [Prolixibacteraceae bacterium]|nr:helix-hairpin-helix domain-containing protein [Prolixibacteraceae bacterium]
MRNKPTIKLCLTPEETKRLRANEIKHAEVSEYLVDDLCALLNIPVTRAKEIYALAAFQSVPSVGIKFAQDLISLGYYSLDELKDKDGAKLIEDLELSTGTWIDPCVEDQCRLVVDYANNHDDSKKWWDFTEERKKYRIENGYPANRPQKAWFELEKYRNKE